MQATEMGILLGLCLLACMEGFSNTWHDTIKASSFCFKRNFGWEMSNWISLDQLLSQMTLIILTFLLKNHRFCFFNIGFVTSSTRDREILDAAVLHAVSTWSW